MTKQEMEQRIKELEEENKELKEANTMWKIQFNVVQDIRLILKKQLYCLPKKICDEIFAKINNVYILTSERKMELGLLLTEIRSKYEKE